MKKGTKKENKTCDIFEKSNNEILTENLFNLQVSGHCRLKSIYLYHRNKPKTKRRVDISLGKTRIILTKIPNYFKLTLVLVWLIFYI